MSTTHHASANFHLSHADHIDAAKEAVLNEAEATFTKTLAAAGFEIHHAHTHVHRHPHAPKHHG